MSDDTMMLYEILVPCQWNDGRPVRKRHHREWDSRIRRIAGGLTIMTPVKGQWVNTREIHDVEVYEDRMIPVRIFCTQNQMDRIARLTIEHYEQEAVMYYCIASWATIHHADSTQKARFTHKRNNMPQEITDALRSSL